MSAASARRRFVQMPQPALAVELAAERVAVVGLDRGAQRPGVIGWHAVERLPAGSLVPALNASNIHDANQVGDALRRAIERSGVRGGRVALVVPDAVARVSILSFETVPDAASDLEQLIRWQARKAVPFAIDTAQVSWQRSAGNEFVVSVARRDIIEEYEAVCARVGLHAGIVDLATFNLINVVLAADGEGGESDWMLVHLTPGDATIAIVRGGELIFFRNKVTAADETVEDLVHQTAMYHEDRLGGGRFDRVIVAGVSAAAGAEARRSIEARFGVPVEAVDWRGAATLRDRIAPPADLVDALAAPLGVLVREVA